MTQTPKRKGIILAGGLRHAALSDHDCRVEATAADL